MRRKKGFTMAELAVVLVVITFIVGATFIALMQRRDVQATEVLTVFQDLARGISMYYSNTGSRPPDLQTLQNRGYITGYAFRHSNAIEYKGLIFWYNGFDTCMLNVFIQDTGLRGELRRRLSDFSGWSWTGDGRTLSYCFPF